MNNYQNEFRILNSTVPEMFRFSSKVQFAETISFIDPITYEDVDILVQSCLALLPISHRYQGIQINDAEIKKVIDLNPTLYSTMISIRSQESVIALSHLYKCSNGVLGDLVPILTSILTYLTYITPTTISSQNDIQNTQNFTYYLLNQLAILSHVSSSSRDHIIPVFIKFFTHISSDISKSEFLPLIYGTLQALGDKELFQFQQDESTKVLQNIESLMNNINNISSTLLLNQSLTTNGFNGGLPTSSSSVSLSTYTQHLSQPTQTTPQQHQIINNNNIEPKKVLLQLLFQSLEQITYLPQESLESDIFKRIYNDIFPFTSTIINNEIFIKIIAVITRCGIMDASIGKEVLDYLLRFISETMNLTEAEALTTMNKPFSEALYQMILESFIEMTDKYQEKAQRVLEVLKDFLCISLIVVKNSVTKNNLFQTICQILKNQYHKERGVDLCKSIIGSFINILATQYQNYKLLNDISNATVEQQQQVQQQSQLQQQVQQQAKRSPSILVSNSTSSSSLLIQYQYRNETLSNVIIILGKITCALDETTITEMIQPVFLSNVTYPPGNIENLIIEQLTDIALLEHPTLTKDITTLFTNFFKKICNDPNQALITNIIPNCLQKLAKFLTKDDLRQDLQRRVLKLFQQLGKFVKNSTDVTSSPTLKGMGFLLPTISELILLSYKNYNTQKRGSFIISKSSSMLDLNSTTTSTNLTNSGTNVGGQTNGNPLSGDDVSLSKLYRTVWFYCVFFKFSVQGTWRSDWYSCVQILANHLSPLISNKAHLHLEIEVELELIIKQGFDKEYFNQLKTTLMDALPNQTAYIKNLTLPQLAFAYSVYSLETMRFQVSGSFVTAFSYLSDQGVENINLINCIQGISDKVFNDFLTRYSSSTTGNHELISDQDLSNYANYLLMKFCYPYEPVRKAADECISTYVAKFPQVLWSKSCLSTLLDLIQVIGRGAKAKPMDLISIPMPNDNNVIVELPDDSGNRIRLRNDVIALGKVWLKSGSASAPSEVQELLQEYIQKFTLLEGQNHIGLSLAVEIGSTEISNKAASNDVPPPTSGNSLINNNQQQQTPLCCNNNAGNFFESFQLKAMYAGEVRGMINTLNTVMMDSEDGDGTNTIDLVFIRFVEDFEKIISTHTKTGRVDIEAFTSIMFRSCAYLINHYKGQSVKLIHMICSTPAYIFTPDSMKIGISCWKWLLSEKPELTIFIMTTIHDIWSWSVNQRIGLFTNTERDPSPLAINKEDFVTSDSASSATGSIDEEEDMDDQLSNSSLKRATVPGGKSVTADKTSHVPHKIWINFLEERFQVSKHNSLEQMDILASMLQKATADPDHLSVSPKSLGTRFKLLLLCLKFIRGDHIRDITCQRLLRERVYLSALSWFNLPPIWYGSNEAGSLTELVSDTKLLLEFCKTLQEEPIFQHLDKKYSTIRNTDRYSVQMGAGTIGTVGGQTIVGQTQTTIGGSGTSISSVGSTPSYGTLRGGKLTSQNNASLDNGITTSPIMYQNNGIRNSPISMSNISLFSNDSPQPQAKLMDQMIGSGVGTLNSAMTTQVIQQLQLINNTQPQTIQSESQLAELRKQRNLIILLVGNELERMSAWNNPMGNNTMQSQLSYTYENLPKPIKNKFKDYLICAWKINPRIAINFNTRFPRSTVKKILGQMVVINTRSVLGIPEALPLLVTEENVKANIPELKYLLYWENVTPPMALSLLGKQYQSHPIVSQYACRVLKSFPPETIMFYIPQLVQALRYDKSGQVENYLVQASKTSELLSNQIIWNIQTYTEPDPNTLKMIEDPGIQLVAKRLKERIINEMPEGNYQSFKSEFDFFESFTAISGRLLQQKDVSKRKGQLKEELKLLTVNSGSQKSSTSPLYLPTNPKSIVVGLEIDSATTLQSAAKVPILVNFKVIERTLPTPQSNDMHHLRSPPPSNSPPIALSNTSSQFPPQVNISNTNSTINNAVNGNNQMKLSPKLSSSHLPSTVSLLRESSKSIQQRKTKRNQNPVNDSQHSQVPQQIQNPVQIQGCIFKSGDDIRQDMLALQIIDVFKRIFKSAGLDLYLFPYKVIATKPGCGMIELVPNTMSRDQIGKKSNGTLYDYFISKYGNKNSVGFQNARRNFIKSVAAYSVVSYILQIKDRHNANILVDAEGHLVHIDFGFIFDISPGGELLTFEASPFKMNQEMIDIMGGNSSSEQFIWFMEQSVKAFLAARQHMDSIITLVEMMLDTHLPCFREQTIANLRSRFEPGKPETTAAKSMSKIVLNSFSAFSTATTYIYDVFQYYDNGIEM